MLTRRRVPHRAHRPLRPRQRHVHARLGRRAHADLGIARLDARGRDVGVRLRDLLGEMPLYETPSGNSFGTRISASGLPVSTLSCFSTATNEVYAVISLNFMARSTICAC